MTRYHIYTFVDFSKAFDSLMVRMWDILEFSGCPPQPVAVIRSLHEHATIALRLNIEGVLAPEFEQKKGIREGSGALLVCVACLSWCWTS
mmetsp:Transcript_25859/g.63641  ORF Transcript_25859/g.63641 Transcript_25859/m.63641 type:complete len:90 (+) Transcript_25859:2361-2630(+)